MAFENDRNRNTHQFRVEFIDASWEDLPVWTETHRFKSLSSALNWQTKAQRNFPYARISISID